MVLYVHMIHVLLTIYNLFQDSCFTRCKLECVYLAERDTSLTPLYGDDTAVLCSFKLSSM